jgi:hypothetical protein
MGYTLAQLLGIFRGQLYRIVTEIAKAPQHPYGSQDSLDANIRINHPNCKLSTTDVYVCNIVLQAYKNFLQYPQDLNNITEFCIPPLLL